MDKVQAAKSSLTLSQENLTVSIRFNNEIHNDTCDVRFPWHFARG